MNRQVLRNCARSSVVAAAVLALAACGSSGGSSDAAAPTTAPASVTPTPTSTLTATPTRTTTARPTTAPAVEPPESRTAAPRTSNKVCGKTLPKPSPVAPVLAMPRPETATWCVYPLDTEDPAEKVSATKADPVEVMRLLKGAEKEESGEDRDCTMEMPPPAAFVLEYADGERRTVNIFNGGCPRIAQPPGLPIRYLTEDATEYLSYL